MATAVKTINESINLRYWEDDGTYFKSWYPVCLSTDLVPGKIKGIDFLNSRIIAYRGQNGEAIVQTAYCPHLGADLSLGDMVDGEVRCPYHHWRFNVDGKCSDIPSLGKALSNASIQNYPVAESWGIVWVFNGREPIGELPTLIGVTEEDVVYRVLDMGVHNVESWIPLTNALDFQHLKSVHGIPHETEGRNFVVEPTSLAFDFDVLHPTGAGKVYFQNCFSMRDLQPFPAGHFAFVASNSPRPNIHHQFGIFAWLKPEDPARLPEIEGLLDSLMAFGYQLNAEDAEIVKSIRFRPRGEAKLVKADRALGMMLDYFDRLPRGAPLD